MSGYIYIAWSAVVSSGIMADELSHCLLLNHFYYSTVTLPVVVMEPDLHVWSEMQWWKHNWERALPSEWMVLNRLKEAMGTVVSSSRMTYYCVGCEDDQVTGHKLLEAVWWRAAFYIRERRDEPRLLPRGADTNGWEVKEQRSLRDRGGRYVSDVPFLHTINRKAVLWTGEHETIIEFNRVGGGTAIIWDLPPGMLIE